MFDALHGGIPCLQINGTPTASFHFDCKCLLKRKEPPEGGSVVASVVNQDQLVVDNDLGAVMVDIPIMIAILDDDRVVIAGGVALVNHFALPNHIVVAMLADRHAGTDRADTHAHANFFGKCRQRSADHRGGRDRSYI
jgi:hypothetical protein